MIDPRISAHLEVADRELQFIDRLRIYVTGPGSLLWTGVLILLAAAWALGGERAVADYLRFPFSDTVTTRAVVDDSGDTNVEINERTVSWVTYTYATDSGNIDGISFGSEYYPGSGRTVQIEYLADAPWFSRIPGKTRVSQNGPVALVFAIAALLFTALAIWRTRKASTWIALMQRGEGGRAKLTSKKPTGTTINEKRVFELNFVYEGKDGVRRKHSTKRHEYDDITDDDEELVMFDADGNVLFYDELPVPFVPGRRGGWRYVGSATLAGAVLKRASVPAIILGIGALAG